jgi:hypothetical protein
MHHLISSKSKMHKLLKFASHVIGDIHCIFIIRNQKLKNTVSENSYLMESLTVNKSSDSISNELGWWTVFVKKVNFFLDTDHIN